MKLVIHPQIQPSWDIILNSSTVLTSDKFGCLVHLETIIDFYHLSPLSVPITTPNFDKQNVVLQDLKPSFKNISEEILLTLRTCIYKKQSVLEVRLWCEKLMRFCELRMSQLKQRFQDKLHQPQRMRVFGLQLISLFLDHFSHSKDYRYLNVALKMQDLGWLYQRDKISALLQSKTDRHPIGLFHFRILLMTEFAFSQMDHHG